VPTGTPGVTDDEVFAIDTSGANRVDLTNSPGTSDRYAAWYPSGKTLLFRRLDPSQPGRELWQLTCPDVSCSSAGTVSDLTGSLGLGRAGSWSPAGSSIAFGGTKPGSGGIATTGGSVTVGGGVVNGHRALSLTLFVPRQSLGRRSFVHFVARCSKRCTVIGGGTAVTRPGAKTRRMATYRIHRTLRAHRRTRISVRIPARTLRAMRGTLRHRRVVRVIVAISARTASGEFTPVAKGKLTLRR
jgi:hypothetical protein